MVVPEGVSGIKSTKPASRAAAQAILILAVLLVGNRLRATDWSTVPVGAFVVQAIAAIRAVPAGEPEALLAELAAVLNAAAVGGVTDADLARIIGTAYGNRDVDVVGLARGVYRLLKPEGRSRLAAALAAAAPADRKQDIAEAIRQLDLPAVPPLSQVVTRTTAIPWGKE